MSIEPRLDLIALGEGMVEFGARTRGPLRRVRTYDVHAAGSELNVAIGAARLGLSTGWIGRVGADEFGALLVAAARADGVDTSRVVQADGEPTGIFVVQRGYPVDGQSSMMYYRAGSAGSRLSGDELDADYLRQTAILHPTGISLAVSPELAAAARSAAAVAAQGGALRSFDVNYRAKLWTPEAARPQVEAALAESEIAFCSLEDARTLWAVADAEAAVELLASFGPGHAVVSCGADGAIMVGPDRAPERAAAIPTTVVDPT